MAPAYAYGRPQAGTERRLLGLTYTVSLIGHLLLFIILVYGPSQMPSPKFQPRVVNVDLVSLPSPRPESSSGGAAARSPGKSPAPVVKSEKPEKPVVKPAPKNPPAKPESPSEAVSLAPRKWKEKTSLKEETFKPEKVVKSAIKRLEKTAEASKPDPLASALDRLRAKVAQNEKGGSSAATSKNAAGVSPPAEGAGAGVRGRGGASGILTSEILLYQHEISYHIRNNWVFAAELADARSDLEARLMVKIMADGEIKDVWFEKGRAIVIWTIQPTRRS